MLRVEDINTYYGRVQALRDVSIKVRGGEIVAIIGANGAGKTTLMHTIHGLLPARSGSIIFNGEDITRLRVASRVRRGLAQVLEGRQLFPGLTVLENLRLGAFVRAKHESKRNIASDLDHMFELFPALRERKAQRAGTLSGGEQQMVAMARALMSAPTLLLLDEPSLGLSPKIKQDIFRTVCDMNAKQGLTVFLVEQDARMALGIAHRGYVMQTGRIVMTGLGSELLKNEEVQRIYLGH